MMGFSDATPQVYHHKLEGAALSAILLPSDDGHKSFHKKRKSEEMRQKHNMISQKGRQRINEEINKLKQILPECRDVECNKAAVLQCAVKNLEKFTKCTSSLWMAVQNLEKETKRLWDTCQDLAGELSQATDRPFEDILEQYTIEPPASMVEQSNIKFGDDMPIPPPTKRQRHQDDIIDDCWSAPLEPY